MLISCPSCRTDYEIADEALPPAGRRARCSACGAVWLATPEGVGTISGTPEPDELRGTIQFDDPPADPAPVERLFGVSPATPAPPVAEAEPDPPPPVQPEGDGAAQPVAAPSPRRRSSGSGMRRDRRAAPSGKGKRWLIAAGVAAAVAVPALLLQQRTAVVRLLPQSAGLFAAVGYPVNIRGIDIVNVTGRSLEDGGVRLLVVEGELVGLGREAVEVPRLRFAVRDGRGTEIYSWTAPADKKRLDPGERMTFRRRLASPPAEGQEVSVRFVNRLDIVAGLK
jgi:predicted Zn finger-like uncharacterized protein